MAQLKDTTVKGNLNLEGNIFGNAEGIFESIPIKSSEKIPSVSFGNVSSIYGRIGMNKADGRLIRYNSKGTGYSVFDKEDVIPISNGGTGLSEPGANNQVLMSNGSSAYWNSINSLKPDCAVYADCARRIDIKTVSTGSLMYTSDIKVCHTCWCEYWDCGGSCYGYYYRHDICILEFYVYSRSCFFLTKPYSGNFYAHTEGYTGCMAEASSSFYINPGYYTPGVVAYVPQVDGPDACNWNCCYCTVYCRNNLINGNINIIETF